MIKLVLIALGATLVLSNCSVPVLVAANNNQGQVTGLFEITVPATMLISTEGFEELLIGNLAGRANGSADLTLTGPQWGDCAFAMTRQGAINGTCSNGQTMSEQAEPQGMSLSGLYVHEGQDEGRDYIMVLGWGNDAEEATVRAALAAHNAAASNG